MNTHKKESLAINFAAWNDHHTELTVVLTGLTGWKYQISVYVNQLLLDFKTVSKDGICFVLFLLILGDSKEPLHRNSGCPEVLLRLWDRRSEDHGERSLPDGSHIRYSPAGRSPDK